MADTLFDIRPLLTRREVIWVIGLILEGVGYGALLTLGITCLVASFRSPQIRGRWFSREKILSAHVALILLGNTFLQVWNAQSTIKAIFYTDPDNIRFFYHGWGNMAIAFLAMLTEGVLVWRCCMIQMALSAERLTSRWHHICWIFPMFLWLAGAGITAIALLNPNASLFDKDESSSPGLTLFLVALAINFTLNVFATSNIVIRLLLLRRQLIAAYGHKNILADYSLRISSILLESAAINLPLALLSIVGLLVQADFAAMLTQIITPGQCIASILVIYQVVRRRTILEQRTTDNQNGYSLPQICPQYDHCENWTSPDRGS